MRLLQRCSQSDVGVDTGEHNRGRKRLVDVIDGPDLEALLFVIGLGLGGEKDHWNSAGRRICLQASTYLVAIHAGHRDIQKDEVRPVAGRCKCKRFLAIGRDLGPEEILENGGYDSDIGRRVVDDQDCLAVGLRHPSAAGKSKSATALCNESRSVSEMATPIRSRASSR